MKRTINGRKYGLRVMDRDAVSSPGLAGSLIYAMQRHAETGRPYMVSSHGHVTLDCPHNRSVLMSDDFGSVAAFTVAL
jgi:hypothetical protein